MTMQVVEREAIVVNNADPLGIGRVQVFIYGVHDITGIKTPFEKLPWAFSTQSTNMVSIPPVWTPLKVKYRFSLGRNILSAFSEQEGLEWHSPSPFIKLSANRDPRAFISYDSENKKWLNETPPDYAAISRKIAELEELKKEKQGFLEANLESIRGVESDSADATDIINEYNQLKQEYQQTQKDLDNLISNQRKLRTSKIETLIDEFESDDYYNNNVKENVSGLTVQELQDTNPSLYQVYLDSYALPKINEFVSQQNLERSFLESKIDFLKEEEQKLSETNKNANIKESNLNNFKVGLQEEVDKLGKEIVEIDKQIADLKTKTSSGARALTSFEQVKSLDARVGRFDETTGKVYNTDEELIGNWTGENFYVPGYALQAGPSIPERKKDGRIKAESYLMGVNNNGSVSGNMSTITDSSDSVAIDKSNNDKEHICDVSYETRMKILMKRQSVLQAVKWLRDQIVAQFSIDAESATAQWIKATIKQLTAMLKSAQKFLKFVNQVVLEIVKIVTEIKKLIKWILSLPAKILALLQDCLTHFYNSIASSFSGSLNVGGVDGTNLSFTEINELVTQAQSTLATATQTVQNTVVVYQEIKTIDQVFQKV